MDAERLTRRSALALGLAAAGATGLSGCARPLAALTPPEIIVRSAYLADAKVASQLRAAWTSSGIAARLNIAGPSYARTFEGDERSGDLLDVTPPEIHNVAKRNFLDLTPLLAAQNFPLASLLPSAVADYQEGSGLRALPLILGEWQFYVNTPLLHHLGLAVPAQWTWMDMVDALAVAVGRGSAPSSVLVGGTGWGHYALWGAFVLGLGGSLASGGHLDLTGAVAATTHLVSAARRYGWHPDQASNPSNVQWWDFYGHGFGLTDADALFSFLQPARIYPGRIAPGVSTLATVPFPRLPAGPVVPAYKGSGLGLSPYARHPDLAVEALLWLYRPAQQRILAEQGWPPVVVKVAEQIWPGLEGTLPDFWAKFDSAGYTDIFNLLTGGRPTNEFEVDLAVGAACQAMYVGADVAGELADLQQKLDPLVGKG